MNKQETLIVVLLFAALLGFAGLQCRDASSRAQAAAQARAAWLQERAAAGRTGPAALSVNASGSAAIQASPSANDIPQQAAAAVQPTQPEIEDTAGPAVPPVEVVLCDADIEITLSSRGGAIVSATLPGYPATIDRGSPPVKLDFQPQPALAIEGLPGCGLRANFEVQASPDGKQAVLRRETADGLALERTVALRPHGVIELCDRFVNRRADAPLVLASNRVSLGSMARGSSANDVLGADALPCNGKAKIERWESRLPGLFTGRRGGFGCGGAPPAASLPLHATADSAGPHAWLALKSRFFVQIYSAATTNAGYRLDVARDAAAANLALATVSAAVAYEGGTIAPGGSLERRATLYVGPKRLSHLWQQGGRRHEVMDFGTFKWLCMALVPTLNGFHALIPNYGVAIALLTLLVRVIFWPLTHKSTESMKRMQALQPQIKAVQEQFKDNPRKLQQETWRLYRENKVNPLSSCLPMLVQLPVFIALYTVLRSGVELRYAPFLWIRDLSEPENLLAGVLPWPHSVNILPFFMSATMAWQSRLTPSMGDPAQQKMMTWLMPIMMLFMFYSMPSALVLYWTVSQVLAIAQLLWQRHRYAPHPVVPATVSAAGQPLTRQMRRRLGK